MYHVYCKSYFNIHAGLFVAWTSFLKPIDVLPKFKVVLLKSYILVNWLWKWQHFGGSTGYGHNDAGGREALDSAFATLVGSEAAIVRSQVCLLGHSFFSAVNFVHYWLGFLSLVVGQGLCCWSLGFYILFNALKSIHDSGTHACALVGLQFFSGTHAIACALYAALRPGGEVSFFAFIVVMRRAVSILCWVVLSFPSLSTLHSSITLELGSMRRDWGAIWSFHNQLLAVAGAPYDTLEEVIGLRGSPNHGSLKEFGVSYRELPVRTHFLDSSTALPDHLFNLLLDDKKKLCICQLVFLMRCIWTHPLQLTFGGFIHLPL